MNECLDDFRRLVVDEILSDWARIFKRIFEKVVQIDEFIACLSLDFRWAVKSKLISNRSKIIFVLMLYLSDKVWKFALYCFLSWNKLFFEKVALNIRFHT